jgi:plasmid stabilization system protein ParE
VISDLDYGRFNPIEPYRPPDTVIDLARLYGFLAPINSPAATRTVQALTAAPRRLLAQPHIGERLDEFESREVCRIREQSMGSVLYFAVPASLWCHAIMTRPLGIEYH